MSGIDSQRGGPKRCSWQPGKENSGDCRIFVIMSEPRPNSLRVEINAVLIFLTKVVVPALQPWPVSGVIPAGGSQIHVFI
jgi:hypothetical protein